MGSAALIEIIGVCIIVGALMLCVFGWTSNLNVAAYNKSFSVIAQGNTITLARMFEYDVRKAGYHYPKPSIAMLSASPDTLSFKGDLQNTGTTINTVKYYVGPPSQAAYSKNPRDRILYRVQDGKVTPANLGVTNLSFRYFNKDGGVTTRLDSIKSVQVNFTIESPAPVDTTYASISWEKRFYPKNL